MMMRPPSIWIGLLGFALLCFESWQWRQPRCGGAEPCAVSHSARDLLLKSTQERLEAGLPAPPMPLDTRPLQSTASARNLTALAALLARPAEIHGRLEKAGAAAVLLRNGLKYYRYRVRLEPGDPQYDSNISSWVETMRNYDTSVGVSQAARDPAAVAKLRSPAPSCFYFVDHKYKVIYARTTKTAGSSVSLMFGFIENANDCNRLGLQQCMKPCMGKAMCLNRTLDVQELQNLWPEYTVFGVARNPHARAVSSWAYNNVRFLANTSCVAPFQRFAALPSAYPYPCMNERNAQWLMALNHIEQQGECLFTLDGRPAVDFLARTEALDEDLQDLVRLINERRPEGVPEHPAPKVIQSNVNKKAADRGSVEQRAQKYAAHYLEGTALEDVRRYFGDDFRLLQID